MGSKFPNQGSNLGPQQRKCQVLTTGSPENSPSFLFVDERTVLSPAEQKSASKQAAPQCRWSLLSSQCAAPAELPRPPGGFVGCHISAGEPARVLFSLQPNWAQFLSLATTSLCCWKWVFAITSVFSSQNYVSLWPASFCTPSPNLHFTWYLLTSYFCIPIL